MKDKILFETASYLFNQIKKDKITIKKAILDIYTTVETNDGSVGTCLCFRGPGQKKKIIFNNIIFHKNFNIEISKDIIISNFDNNYIRSLFLAIVSAMSRDFLTKFAKKESTYPVKLNRKKDSVVQIGFCKSSYIDYSILKEIYIFDKIYPHTYRNRIEDIKIAYRQLKDINRNIRIFFMNEIVKDHKILNKADVLVVSGSTLANGTLDEILENSNSKKTVLWGRSCSIYPVILFKKRISYLHSSLAPLNLMRLASNNYNKYINMSEPGRKFILRSKNK